MSEREGRKFFLWLQVFLAAFFLIVGVALAIETVFGGYAIGLFIVAVITQAHIVFFILAALSAATAMHLRS